MQQNARDETINHIISECSKLAQREYKTRPDRVDTVIHRELCMIVESDFTNEFFMHK